MIDRITPISQIQRIAEIQKAQQMQPVRQSLSSGESARGTQAQEGFGALLRQELDKAAGSKSIAFSKHALSRAAERGIEVTPALVKRRDQYSGLRHGPGLYHQRAKRARDHHDFPGGNAGQYLYKH